MNKNKSKINNKKKSLSLLKYLHDVQTWKERRHFQKGQFVGIDVSLDTISIKWNVAQIVSGE